MDNAACYIAGTQNVQHCALFTCVALHSSEVQMVLYVFWDILDLLNSNITLKQGKLKVLAAGQERAGHLCTQKGPMAQCLLVDSKGFSFFALKFIILSFALLNKGTFHLKG